MKFFTSKRKKPIFRHHQCLLQDKVRIIIIQQSSSTNELLTYTSLHVVSRQLKTNARYAVRAYATEAPVATSNRVDLDEKVAKHLKPEVIKVINSKTDQLLIRKLNFIGPAMVVRLNVANDIILGALSQENCLRILTEELQDPWDYYWVHVKQNGSDVEKWMESMKEVKHLPWVVTRCWTAMQRNGVFPHLEQYHVLFDALANIGDYMGVHDQFDALKRRNYHKKKPTEETYNLILALWINKGLYPLAKMAADLVAYRGFTVRPDVAAKLQELQSKWNEDADLDWYLGNVKEEPASVKEYRDKEQKLLDNSFGLLEAYYQPPMEKLIVKN
jgi:hypothetical protein